ncbi:mechanosensitive ion channel family protein [Spirochaetota bacterium]
MIREFLNNAFLNNKLGDYLICLGFIIAAIVVIKIFKVILLRRLKGWSENTDTSLDDFIILNIERAVIPILYLSAFYYSITSFLILSDHLSKFVYSVFVIVLTFYVIRSVVSIIKYMLKNYLENREDGDEAVSRRSIQGISSLINLIVWGIGLIFLLDNLGFKISAVVAGLGIGGIAVALAGQAILGDLFSYFVIVFDKPFHVGDYIVVGEKEGTVEKIGIKTTRITSLTGEQLVLPNTDLTKSRIHNYKKMKTRRVQFSFGVTYNTGLDNLRAIPAMVEKIILSEEDTKFDRAHFKEYGDFSLNFVVVYYVHSAEYNRYMDIQQNINLKLFEEFRRSNIYFAYPTQSIVLEKD